MSKDHNPKKILITRTDRLGDVMLATPVLKKVRESFPSAEIVFLVQKMWMPVLQYGPGVKLLEFNPEESANQLAERLRVENFDVAVVIRDERKVSRAVKKARIPVRVGPYSSLRSFFSFNRGLFQKRSRSVMHEAEYNLQLLSKIGIPFSGPAHTAKDLPRSWVEYDPSAIESVSAWLSKNELADQRFIVLHPGSSGSARYLSTETLILLTRNLLKAGLHVVLTGTKPETGLLNELVHGSALIQAEGAAPVQRGKLKVFGGENPQPLAMLAELYRRSELVIAHGTGPLHLAAAVGTPVYAIFPPIHVLSETRWGPLVTNRTVWIPNVPCPAYYRCLGPQCEYFDCMARFDAPTALNVIQQTLSQKLTPNAPGDTRA